MQSRLTQQFALTLKDQKLGGQLSGGALQTEQQLIKVTPEPMASISCSGIDMPKQRSIPFDVQPGRG